MNIVSFFAGAGGFDQGFKEAGFNIIWANDFNPTVRMTYEKNHPKTTFVLRSIVDISTDEVPDCDGIIGGPPCQSWSIAGSHGGESDPRGKLFWEFLRIIEAKQPKFFIAENVKNITSKQHRNTFNKIKRLFRKAGYSVRSKTLNASEHQVPQDRNRTFVVGIRDDATHHTFRFPRKRTQKVTLNESIGHLKDIQPTPTQKMSTCDDNNEYLDESFSPHFMSRNRVRSWNEQSFTLLAMARHTVLHPQAPKMVKVNKDLFQFKKGKEHLYRRLSVKECALIQTFPGDFIFHYDKIHDGYKMIGNAVPPKLAYHLAIQIKRSFDV